VSPVPPLVTVVIPTLNSERYLAECLGSLAAQDYSRERLEVLIVDAGSTDATVAIARQYGVDQVLANPLKTGEAGKAVGISAARGELICMFDSDNVLVGRDWLSRMVAPFDDPEVVSSEALRWDYRRGDHFINRYCALTGVNDPLALFVGNYDRHSALTGRWTDYPYASQRRDGWEKVELDPEFIPTMGANGYIVRRSAFDSVPVGEYFFDIDFVYELAQAGCRTIARVDVPIRHYFCDSVWRFYRKTRRRADDFFYYSGRGDRTYPWTSRRLAAVSRFIASTVLLVPLLAQVARGLRTVRDPAWLFHVPACWITLLVYASGAVRGRMAPSPLAREGWSQ
jgi:glycosyltransferase involved in cell wall biosynthesis